MSIVLGLQSKSLPQLSVQTNSLELIFYYPLIKRANSSNEISSFFLKNKKKMFKSRTYFKMRESKNTYQYFKLIIKEVFMY